MGKSNSSRHAHHSHKQKKTDPLILSSSSDHVLCVTKSFLIHAHLAVDSRPAVHNLHCICILW